MENRKVKQVLSGGWYSGREGGYGERVKEGDVVEICTHV
jgi:hypothetical protein